MSGTRSQRVTRVRTGLLIALYGFTLLMPTSVAAADPTMDPGPLARSTELAPRPDIPPIPMASPDATVATSAPVDSSPSSAPTGAPFRLDPPDVAPWPSPSQGPASVAALATVNSIPAPGPAPATSPTAVPAAPAASSVLVPSPAASVVAPPFLADTVQKTLHVRQKINELFVTGKAGFIFDQKRVVNKFPRTRLAFQHVPEVHRFQVDLALKRLQSNGPEQGVIERADGIFGFVGHAGF